MGDEVALSPAQQEALALALERGYFEIPRQGSLIDLSEEIGISDQALSERLHRAQGKFAHALADSRAPTVTH